MQFETRAIRTQAGRTAFDEHGVPLYLTSGFVFSTGEEAAAAFAGENSHPIYGRFDNPNTDEFAQRIAELEGTEAALSTGSGMSAVFLSVMGLLRSGDHIVGSRQVFGSTLSLMKEFFPRWGIESTLVDLTDPQQWEDACTEKTRMFVLETPSNPGLEIADLAALSEIARKRGILVNVDNCFATPALQRPAEFGADIVVHSATKFIDGQGRVLGGVVAASKEIIEEIMPFYRNSGPSMSPFNAWVLSRSLETLTVRMERHSANALQIATALEQDSRLRRVSYPGLASHPQHALAMKQMSTGGGLFTLELPDSQGSCAPAMAFLNALEMISRSVNLGDTRTIATHPFTTTHSKLPEPLRKQLGITPGLIRISVGLEAVEDILADITQALEAAVQADSTAP